MKYNHHPFCKYLKYGFSAALLAVFILPTSVVAQDEEDDDDMFLEEVIVTGSRLQRSDYNSMSPISVFSDVDILESGMVTLERFVQSIPSVSGGYYSSGVNNGTRGYATVSMRGLGSNRTLVLVNGLRMPSVGANGFVDLNTIPVIAVERIEVLRDGASTSYGSDAIAGVVNIITKTNFEGVTMRAQYDVTQENDGKIYTASMLIGSSNDRGGVVMAMDYTDREVINQGDRDFSACPVREGADGLFCGGSGTAYPGQFRVAVNEDHPEWQDHPLAGQGLVIFNDEVVPFESERDAFNFAELSYMVTPAKVWSVYSNSHFDLIQESKMGTVTAWMDFVWSNRTSEQKLAPVGTFWSPTLPASSPYNPLGVDVTTTRRLVEAGGRAFSQDYSNWRIVAGLRGEFNNGWNWDAVYNLGRGTDARIERARGLRPQFETMLDPVLCAADPKCPEVWDPLHVDTLSEAQEGYALIDHSPVSKNKLETWQINLAGDVTWFELPGGLIQWAVGYENRSEKAEFIPDGAAALDLIYNVSPDATFGEYEVKEMYGEIRVPILQGMSFADILAFEASVRSSDYDTLEDKSTNWKFGLEWAPIRSLRFRGVYSEGFRNPNISELYGPQQMSAQDYSDPCNLYGSAANAVVAANCVRDGLAPDFLVDSDQASSIVGGNPDMIPESSESITVGVVFSPEAAPGLEMSLDFFNIKIANGVGTAGTNNIISGCYNSPNFSSPWCDLIVGPGHPLIRAAPSATAPFRDALDSISGVLITNANLSDYETQGIDFAVNYAMDAGPGQLSMGVMGTYLDKFNYIPFEGADEVELAGFFGEDQFILNIAAFPEWKVNFNFAYYMGNWSFAWLPRWFSSTFDANADDANFENTAKAIWYNDIQAAYDLGGWNFALGARNVFNAKPPYVSNNGDMNTIHFSYDTAGAYYYGRVSYSF